MNKAHKMLHCNEEGSTYLGSISSNLGHDYSVVVTELNPSSVQYR